MIDAEISAERNTSEREVCASSLEYTHAMRPIVFPNGSEPSPSSPRIGSRRDVLRCLHGVMPVLAPGDSLVLLLNREQRLRMRIQVPADLFHPVGPPVQQVFREAFSHLANRLVIATIHPSCRTGSFMPAKDHFQHAAKCSLAGQLLDLRLVDYLIGNDTHSHSLLIDFRDELYRYALQNSQEHAHVVPYNLCPN